MGDYNALMDHIGANLEKIEQNIKVNSADPIALHGFTQLSPQLKCQGCGE